MFFQHNGKNKTVDINQHRINASVAILAQDIVNMSNLGPGPNLERNRESRRWHAEKRLRCWAKVAPGEVPESVRKKAELRQRQRARANAQAAARCEQEAAEAASSHHQARGVRGRPAQASDSESSERPWRRARVRTSSHSQAHGGRGRPAQASDRDASEPPRRPTRGRGRPAQASDPDASEPPRRPTRVRTRSASPLPPTTDSVRHWTEHRYAPPDPMRHIRKVYVISHDCEPCCCDETDDETRIWVADLFWDKRTICDGRNPGVQERLLSTHRDNFASLCNTVFRVLTDQPDDVCWLSFVCRRGKHRSVACACLFWAILDTMGIDTEVCHKSMRKHERWCTCATCNATAPHESARLCHLFMHSIACS